MEVTFGRRYSRVGLGVFRISCLAFASALLVGLMLGISGCKSKPTPELEPLPPGYSHVDDVQYFAPRPDTVLADEAAATKAHEHGGESRSQDRSPASEQEENGNFRR